MAMAKLRREMLAVNSFRERLYDNPVGHIWMTTDGELTAACDGRVDPGHQTSLVYNCTSAPQH